MSTSDSRWQWANDADHAAAGKSVDGMAGAQDPVGQDAASALAPAVPDVGIGYRNSQQPYAPSGPSAVRFVAGTWSSIAARP